MTISRVNAQVGRMRWVDVVRGFAVFLVVFYHVVIALKVTDTPPPAWGVIINDAFAPFRMPTLMFCSGLLLTRSLLKPPKEYIVGKLRRIGWPYLVWTTVLVSFLMAGSRFAGDGNYTPARIVELLTSPTTYTWYLFYLLVFYMVSLIMPARLRLWSIPLLFIVSALVHDGDGWSRAAFLFAFFLMGDFAMQNRDRWGWFRKRPVLVIAGLAAVATAGLSIALPGARYEIWAAFGVMGGIVVAVPLGTKAAETWLGGRVADIGKDSLIYYVSHWIAVTAGVHAAHILHIENGTVLTFALLAAGLGVSWAMVRLSRRFWIFAALYAWPTWPPRLLLAAKNSSK